jgi:tetratricopeptide (TPR) repeat protein
MPAPLLLRRASCLWLAMLLPVLLAQALQAAVDLDETRTLFLKGDYKACIKACDQAIADDESSDDWRVLLARSFLATGRYTNAYSVVTTNLDRFPWSVKLRLLGHEVARRNGQLDEAMQFLRQLADLGRSRMWAYQDGAQLTVMARAALLLGEEPKLVLKTFDLARKRDPDSRDAYLASGELALEKGDFKIAAKSFADGLKKFPDDAEFHYGLARAYAPSDRPKMLQSIEAAIERNSNHVPARLLLAEHLIDAEDYLDASKVLDRALGINPWHPEAWALRSVLAELKPDASAAASARAKALKFWSADPSVDHIIGRKLSQKYRFKEGAARQRQALAFDTNYLPARIQLAQDQLRLGHVEEGWALAHAVHEADAYDVTAFNLVTLHDNMTKFITLTNAHFILRMATNEAPVYGAEVLALLDRAYQTLAKKYDFTLHEPVTVEIFPAPKDFGVRTFGMPGNPGYLGVCFGSVITANSPASQAGHPSNWQAVLWHEFCHVVTLQLTRNKMPRWLSEGISVFEEKQENPSWGQEMNPRYREMILGQDFVPLGELSGAFLAPKTDHHLQFAYYESSLAVEFLVKRFGIAALQKVLKDLAAGAEINAAIAKHTADLTTLEKDFEKFARDRAEQLAPGLDFEKPSRGANAQAADVTSAAAATNFYALTREARRLLREKKWEEAKGPAEKLLTLFPSHTGDDSPYELLATSHRGLGETNAERVILERWAVRDADSLDAYARLMELSAAAGDWGAVATNAQRYLAVNPLVHPPYGFLARAAEAMGRTNDATRAVQTLLRLDPPDPAGAHFQLARLLRATGDAGAKRQVLLALEEAPRFRDAQKLLLELAGKTNAPAARVPSKPSLE